MDGLIGSVIDSRYRIEAVIGQGAHGTVYRARHQRVPRDLAVKILPPGPSADARSVARFEREMRAEAVLNHPNVVQILDYGFADAMGYYIVMELLHGEALSERLLRGPLPIVELYAVFEQTCEALGAAHERGVVHRDLKAENIFLAENEPTAPFTVRLLDFGVARVMRPDDELEVVAQLDHSVVGTPYTMSPEQIRHGEVDGRADIYALGVVLFEMLTGELPFVAETLEEIWRKHLTHTPPKPSSRPGAEWITPELDAVVVRMLAKETHQRYQTVKQAREALNSVRPGVEDAWAAAHLTTSQPGAKTSGLRAAARRRTRKTLPRLSLPKAELRAPALPQVLIVDDEEAIRRLAARLANQQGYDSVLAATGDEALAWLDTHDAPAAVVLDILLWGQDGLSVLRELRRRGFSGPVIVCSGVHAPEVRAEAERLGATAFLEKPGGLLDLGSVLASHIAAG